MASRAPHGTRGIDEKQERSVRHHALDGGKVELEHGVHAEAAGDPLVGERGVDVAVAEHIRPPLPGWDDHALHELGAGCGEQGRLRPGRHLRPMEEQLAEPFAELGPTRLARDHDLAPRRLEVPAQALDLRRLAGAVEPLEGHEHPET
jgi:hypothetical protein